MERYDVTLTTTGAGQTLPMNARAAPFTVGVAVEVQATATLTYKVQHTFWPYSTLIPMSSSVVWFDHPVLSGAASLNSSYTYNVTAVRLNLTGHTSGQATIRVLQGTIAV